MDSRIWGFILHVDPFAKQDDIVCVKWINADDLFIKFVDGRKFIYDTSTGYFRCYEYDRHSITEQQWKNEFKVRLNDMMRRTRINQEELADRLGTTQPMVSRYCTGSAMPSPYMIHKIALILGCQDEDLLFQDY